MPPIYSRRHFDWIADYALFENFEWRPVNTVFLTTANDELI